MSDVYHRDGICETCNGRMSIKINQRHGTLFMAYPTKCEDKERCVLEILVSAEFDPKEAGSDR